MSLSLVVCGRSTCHILKLQNAETTRVASSSSSKRVVLVTEGFQRQLMRAAGKVQRGWGRTKGDSTTMAFSTLKILLGPGNSAAQARRGSGHSSSIVPQEAFLWQPLLTSSPGLLPVGFASS
eukprot:1595551-Pleurochrysis_carterae.AAC.4